MANGKPREAKISQPIKHRGWALLAILCMTFMETLDATIVNVALPTMQEHLGVGSTDIQLVSSVFLVCTCAFLLIFGRLGDMLGKTDMFQLGVVLFTLGSAVGASSATLEVLIVARALQALGAAASLANNQGIIAETFPDSRGKALGLVATFTALGAMAGPTVGGVLVSFFPWESIFLINLPIGLLSLALGLFSLPRIRPEQKTSFDVLGAVVLVPGILLSFTAVTLLEHGVTPIAVGSLVGGLALVVLFVVIERRVQQPLVNLKIFCNASFDIDLVAMVLVFMGLSGVTMVMPFYLQQALGLDPALAGLIMACYPLVNATVGTVCGALSDRIGCVPLTLAGQGIFICGLLALAALTLSTPLPLIAVLLMFTSLGTAMFQSPNNSMIMGHADPKMLGFVGSLGNLMRYFGQSLGVSISMGGLYASMSIQLGYRVDSYVAGRPDAFLSALTSVLHLLAAFVAIGLALSLFRSVVLNAKPRRS